MMTPIWLLSIDAEWSTLLVGYPKWKVGCRQQQISLGKDTKVCLQQDSQKYKQVSTAPEIFAGWYEVDVDLYTQQVTLLPTSTEELSIPPALLFTKDQRKR